MKDKLIIFTVFLSSFKWLAHADDVLAFVYQATFPSLQITKQGSSIPTFASWLATPNSTPTVELSGQLEQGKKLCTIGYCNCAYIIKLR